MAYILQIWYHNVPHTKLAVVKGHQNWVKVSGEFLTFPGGGTQFKYGALHYIDVIQDVIFLTFPLFVPLNVFVREFCIFCVIPDIFHHASWGF